LVANFHVPAAVAGYTSASILAAVHSVLQQYFDGEAHVDNCCQAMVRPEGNAMARDQLYRAFDLVDGDWRGFGGVARTAYRLRHAYSVVDANARYPDYREELRAAAAQMPPGCECAAVLLGQKEPEDCPQFSIGCNTAAPYGPCMASEDATCYVRGSR
jgi:hydrogenase expression/formation protein HypD